MTRMTPVQRAFVGRVLVALFATGALVCDAAPPRRSSSKKKPQVRLSKLKTPEQKRAYLEFLRHSMPTRSAGRSIRFSSSDFDKLLETQIKAQSSQFAPLVDDSTYARRVHLDLLGRIPTPQELRQFQADTGRRKRADLVDRLLETEDFARHWAKYWTQVIMFEATANRNRINPTALEDWLFGQFRVNAGWDRITSELVSAAPVRNKEKKNDFGQDVGPNNFILAFDNKPTQIAAQTARIFMGISIRCAECHDHPFDRWTREQFHEMSAFFARGRHFMTKLEDPTKRTKMEPRFLLGEEPDQRLNADGRRVAIAAFLVYNPQNYWYARAYVNRVWSLLVGDGFYDVDSLGPDQEVVHRTVVNRLAALFRYRSFDPKWVFRVLMNSNAYQREIRTMDDGKLLFTAVRPQRLNAEQVVAALEVATGELPPPLEKAITRTFRINPSVPQKSLEGAIQQPLFLMNNRGLQGRLRSGPLRKELLGIKDNREMLQTLYQSLLTRDPSPSEFRRGEAFLKKVPKRADAVDDLVWVLVNSTEFHSKR